MVSECRFARVMTIAISVTICAMSQPVMARIPPTLLQASFVPWLRRGIHPKTSPLGSMALRISPAKMGRLMTINKILGAICHRFE